MMQKRRIGDKVTIFNRDGQYTTYPDMFTKMKFRNVLKNECRMGQTGIIFAIEQHEDHDDTTLFGVEFGTNQALVSEKAFHEEWGTNNNTQFDMLLTADSEAIWGDHKTVYGLNINNVEIAPKQIISITPEQKKNCRWFSSKEARTKWLKENDNKPNEPNYFHVSGMFIPKDLNIRMFNMGYRPRQAFAYYMKIPLSSPGMFTHRFMLNDMREDFIMEYNGDFIIPAATYQETSNWLWKMGRRFEYTNIGGNLSEQVKDCLDSLDVVAKKK